MREVAALVLQAAIWGVVGLCATELALRAAGLPDGATVRASDAYDFSGAGVGAFRPGAHIRMRWPPELAYDASFNSWGGRGAEPRKDAATRILALGDSYTFGLGVEDDETWPAQLDRILAEAGHPAAVLDIGSPYLLIDDQLRYLDEALPRYAPDIVVFEVPSNGPDMRRDLDAPTPHQHSRERERRSRSSLGHWFGRTALDEARTFVYLWRERLAFRARGRYLRVGNNTGRGEPADRDARRSRYERRLRELADRVEAAGARLLLAPFPNTPVEDGRVDFRPPWTGELAERMGLPHADVYAAFEAQPDPNALLQLPYDTHPSALGQRVAAEAVASELLRRGWID